MFLSPFILSSVIYLSCITSMFKLIESIMSIAVYFKDILRQYMTNNIMCFFCITQRNTNVFTKLTEK